MNKEYIEKVLNNLECLKEIKWIPVKIFNSQKYFLTGKIEESKYLTEIFDKYRFFGISWCSLYIRLYDDVSLTLEAFHTSLSSFTFLEMISFIKKFDLTIDYKNMLNNKNNLIKEAKDLDLLVKKLKRNMK